MGKNLRSSFLGLAPIQTLMLRLHLNPIQILITPTQTLSQSPTKIQSMPPQKFLLSNAAAAFPAQIELLLHPQLHFEIEILLYNTTAYNNSKLQINLMFHNPSLVQNH